LRQENLITESEFKTITDLVNGSGMSKSKFAMRAGINPGYFLRVINKGVMSRKMYTKLIEVGTVSRVKRLYNKLMGGE